MCWANAGVAAKAANAAKVAATVAAFKVLRMGISLISHG
jgi:hypothetical protein